jgi:curved DNA-binding protein CbpA
MNIHDAEKILNLTGDYTPELVKAAYRKACSAYHPDRNPAGLEMMKLVNQAYDALRDKTGTAKEAVEGDLSSYGEDIFNALSKIIHLGLDIEICGAWVWLHGDTKPHKEILKEAGFRWAPKKMLWYFRPADYKSKGRGKFSMDEIRNTHGSEKVTVRDRQKLRAA